MMEDDVIHSTIEMSYFIAKFNFSQKHHTKLPHWNLLRLSL